MLCGKCGFNNTVAMNFCGNCASPLRKICSKCQTENPVSFQFCGNCAQPLQEFGEEPLKPSANPSSNSENINDSPLGHNANGAAASSTAKSGDKLPAITPGIAQHLHSSGIGGGLAAERRQLTVMFCDLVGSTQLSQSLDPEDLREIMQQYRRICTQAIEQSDGYTAQFLGDGILAYFGYPQANEDDARRAAHAGMHILNKLSELNEEISPSFNVNLSIRIGIHTGLVVIGDILSQGDDNLALGTTPNIAARIQDLANANELLVSADTYKLIHSFFRCGDLGEQELKGFNGKFKVYRVDTAHEQRHYFNEDNEYLPLFGRKQEASLLSDRLDQAIAGTGQAVLLSGEAGIGKSRLAEFLREQVSSVRHTLIECWGSPLFQNSYLHPIISVLRRFWHLDELDDDKQQIKQISTTLYELGLPSEEALPILCDLLGINGDFPERPQLSAIETKRRTLDLLLDLLTVTASNRLVVVIAEDLHWIDPTSLELIGLLIDQVPTMRILVLLTFRMEFTPPWKPRAHLTQISINRLTRNQSGQLLKRISKGKTLPLEVFEQIIDKTDGIPFFIEELTRTVLDSEQFIEYDDHYRLRMPMSQFSIPSTLQDSLMAKLDRLGPDKELAQICAIVGREFQHDLLKAVIETSESQFEKSLSALVLSEMLYQRGLPPHSSYMFRHALVHEAAYQSLLKKTRLKYHQIIAAIISERFPHLVDQNPEIIAHHYHQASDWKKALNFWLIAGERALRRCAAIDAIIHLSKGLECFNNLDANEQNAGFELTLQARLGMANIMTRGYGSAEVEACYSRAYALSHTLQENNQSFPILCGLWEYYVARSELASAADLGKLMEKSAQQLATPRLLTEAKRAIGSTLFWQGKLNQAKIYLLEGISEPPNRRQTLASIAVLHDPTIAALSNFACLLWLQDESDLALQHALKAVSLAESINHPFSSAYANLFCAVIYQLRNDPELVLKHAQHVWDIAERYNFVFWQAMSLMLIVWAKEQRESSIAHIEQYVEAMKLFGSTGSRLTLSYYLGLLANIKMRHGLYADAMQSLNEALNHIRSSGEAFFQAEIYRLKATCLAAEMRMDYSQEVNRIKSEEIRENLMLAYQLASEQGAIAIIKLIAITKTSLPISIELPGLEKMP